MSTVQPNGLFRMIWVLINHFVSIVPLTQIDDC